MESPETDHINMANWCLTKEQRKYNGAKTVFLTNGAGKTGHIHAKKKKSLNTDLISFTKMNSKWVTDPNVKHKTIKLLEDNTGETQKIQEKPR